MRNGEPELAHAIVAERFALHLTPPSTVDPQTVNTPAAVERWVIAHRAKFQCLRFDTNCGPFVDVAACVVGGPWFAETSTDGSSPPVCGMDTTAFRDGRIVEYWTIGKVAETVSDLGAPASGLTIAIAPPNLRPRSSRGPPRVRLRHPRRRKGARLIGDLGERRAD